MTQFSFEWILSLNWLCQKWGQVQTYFGYTFTNEPQYSYNPSLKTCLWADEYWSPTDHVQFILDVYTNKTLIEYTEQGIKQIGDVSYTDFARRKAELFGSH
jgi:hypothetical protein